MRSVLLNANIYRSNNCAKRFLLDVVSLVEDFQNIEIYFKTKRVLNSKYHSKTYIDLIETLKKIERLNLIDGGCSPFRLIKSTDLSISIPFTSTALIGKHMNKPSCFYDPLNILDKDDRASQNLEVVKGKKIYKCGLASMYKIFITIKENSQRVKKKNFIRFKNNTPFLKF